jgi:hypothetical protein
MMMAMPRSMKTLLSLLLLSLLFATALLAADKPEVEVYLIRKFEMKEGKKPQMDATILEISNPTERTYYVHGLSVETPAYDIEVKRGDKWLMTPRYNCGVGIESFPLKPGAKMLVTVNPPWDEPVSRFRFYFFTTDDEKTTEVVTVRSRAIERKELGDLTGTIGETTSEKTKGFEELRTDEEMNKEEKGSSKEGAKDPFAE